MHRRMRRGKRPHWLIDWLMIGSSRRALDGMALTEDQLLTRQGGPELHHHCIMNCIIIGSFRVVREQAELFGGKESGREKIKRPAANEGNVRYARP